MNNKRSLVRGLSLPVDRNSVNLYKVILREKNYLYIYSI